VAAHSTHPFSRAIAGTSDEVWPEVRRFHEEPGAGIAAKRTGQRILIGSSAWLQRQPDLPPPRLGPSRSGGGHQRPLSRRTTSRPRLPHQHRGHWPASLAPAYQLAVVSGDSEREEARLRGWFGPAADLRFHQKPAHKLEAVRQRQAAGGRVLMLGDGLNDAGALRQADVGVAVTDDIASFAPACDIILDARPPGPPARPASFFARTLNVIRLSFAVSLLYNAAGPTWACPSRPSGACARCTPTR
jgi:Cu+-exporting ATPase